MSPTRIASGLMQTEGDTFLDRSLIPLHPDDDA